MPDLLAGTIVNAGDVPPTVQNVQDGSYTFNITSFGVTTTGGSYTDCGTAFTAPTTGRVKVTVCGDLFNDTAAQFAVCSFVIRDGSTVGSGAVFQAASDSNAIVNTGTSPVQFGTTKLVTGLTPGNVYNVRLEHRVGANNGTLLRRSVCVAPAS